MLRCNLISIMDHISFISFRVFFHMKRTDYHIVLYVRYTRLDAISIILWMFTPCFVYCLALSAFCVRQTYLSFFQSLFHFRLISMEWNGPKYSFNLNAFYFHFECFASEIVIRKFVPRKKWKNSCIYIIYYYNNAKRNMEKNLIVSNVFNNFAYFLFYFLDSDDDCCKR